MEDVKTYLHKNWEECKAILDEVMIKIFVDRWKMIMFIFYAKKNKLKKIDLINFLLLVFWTWRSSNSIGISKEHVQQ